ncbi:MAG TPA: acyl-CoA dehydrogenase family protein [Burkholderiales bacterium]|nr:acyl-CoA dehydrogenase family protein [Burkholderiales bacterium]
MLASFSLDALELPEHLERLREDVRRFLRAELEAGSYTREPSGWDRYDPAFSRKVAAQGWIGMTWPRQYGGHERTSLERYVVTEELLAAGAPVRAHWLADRQFGPLLLAAGSEAQKRTYLPRIAAGECYVCVGMSEPDSGSDLASIRTKATKVDGGWRVNGRKVWTSYAHKAHLMNLFARTSPFDEKDRHSGVTQFIVDLDGPGITISPIVNLAGDHDFNEVLFEDVFVADDRVIGEVGQGWKQVSGELAHERAGSERWLNAYGVLVHLIDSAGPHPDAAAAEKIGRLVTHLWTLHRMSFSLAGLLNKGITPAVEAALVKDLGNQFDQDIPEAARQVLTEEARAALPEEDRFDEMLDRALLYAPSYPIRGGTREILRGIIARGLGLR